jgi:HK97 family phage portal protein
MNLEQLPIIGQAIARRNEQRLQRIIDSLPTLKVSESGKKSLDVLGGILDIPDNSLSNETTISKKLLQANKEWVYLNNDVIAREVSKMDFELYQMGIKDGEIVYTEIETHPLLDLLDRPNEETSKSDALYIVESHKKLTGDAFWLKLRSGRKVVALRSLPPDKITLNLQDPTNDDPTVIKNFEYHDVINGEKVDVIYQPEDIIHIKKPNPSNYFRGYGAVEAMAETIDVDNLTNLTTKRFFQKGAITNFVLKTDQKVNTDQIKRIQSELKQMYGGANNAYRTMILGGGLTPEKLTFSNKDMEFLAQLTWYRDKIMSGFGNTLASLGMLDDVNRATHESSMIEWKRNTIKPDMDSIINALNEFLVPEFGGNLVLGYTDPIPEDRTDDIAEATELYVAGIIMLNEARELTDYESVPDGDTFYSAPQPFNPLAPAADPGANPADNPDDEATDEEIQNIEDNEGEGTKIYRSKNLKLRKRKLSEVPRSISHIEGWKSLLRRRGIYLKLRQNKDLKDALKEVAETIVKAYHAKGKKITVEKAIELAVAKAAETEADTYVPPHNSKFSAEEILAYRAKQLHDVDAVEEHFDKAIIKFLTYVNNKIMDKLEATIEGQKSLKAKKKAAKEFVTKDVFDDNEDDFQAQAQLDFTPLLENLGIIAGQDAYKMVGITDPYLASAALKTLIAGNVEKFTRSMLETDRQHITDVITNGIENGNSVIEIRNTLTGDDMLSFSKMQSTRITRTEVLRASNQSGLDAWKQSGVVEGKQWITAGADDECADYEGQIETLSGNFYDDTSEFADGDPPLHPNCRCTLIPIVTDAGGD